MFKLPPSFPSHLRRNDSRRGTILALFAILLPVLLIVAAFAINIAYLQLTRTELMAATDASARAGGRAISAYQNVPDAKTAATATAALNQVAGSPLRVRWNDADNEVEFGDAEPTDPGSDRFQFTKIPTSQVTSGAEQASAMRITGKREQGSLSGPVSALFPTFGMTEDFGLTYQAVSMQVDRDIALIIDRSGSMNEHPGYDWPSGFDPWDYDSLVAGYNAGILGYRRGSFYYRSGQNSRTYQDYLYEDYLDLGAAPMTPWEELVVAVDVFLTVLENTDQDEQVSLASYATNATLDQTLVTDYDQIREELEDLSPSGNTAIGRGMQTGIPSLLDSYARPFAAKTLLVMTDGIHNTGPSPVTVANTIVASYDVTIHSVTFGVGADQSQMQQVATIGGGEHYHADTGDELQEIFEEIANNLPTIVVQ